MSLFGTWSVYIETTCTAGSRRWPSYSYPSIRRPTITSACELRRYSVMMVAIRFFASARADHASTGAAFSRWRRLMLWLLSPISLFLNDLAQPFSRPPDGDIDHGLTFRSRGQLGFARKLLFLLCRCGVLDVQLRLYACVVHALPVDALRKRRHRERRFELRCVARRFAALHIALDDVRRISIPVGVRFDPNAQLARKLRYAL